MAGRRRRDIRPPEMPDKPAAEWTAEDVAALRSEVRRALRELEKPRREAKLRAGRIRPRTYAEMDVFAADLLARRTPDE